METTTTLAPTTGETTTTTSARGRKRVKLTKTVAFIRNESGVYVRMGRGKPKSGADIRRVEVPFDFEGQTWEETPIL